MTAFRTACVGLLAALLAACAPEPRSSRSGFAGVELAEPLAKPAVTLTDTEGRPYDLRAETDGRLTLLFFGYTNCPDVCPVHMANLAAVLREGDPGLRSRLRVLFVTTDPARDTPERLREWLGAFDRTFVGLTAPLEEVNRVQAMLHLPPAAAEPAMGADSAYGVGHASQIIAFSPHDDRAYVVYPFGTRQRDWAADIPRLLHHEW